MLKPLTSLAIAALLGATPALARQTAPNHGPPAPDAQHAAASAPKPGAPGVLGPVPTGPEEETLLTANGVTIANGGARRPIAPNTELALEPARGLVDQFGDPKKPMRFLLRVGTRF